MTFARTLGAALRLLVVLTAVVGLAYPLTIAAAARTMPGQADGSLVTVGDRVVGSRLLGEATTGPQWFAARPSAVDHSGAASGGSNLGPNEPAQIKAVQTRRAELLAANPDATGPIPDDALTASASGLDPDVSVAYARWQAPRVAAARHLDIATVLDVIDAHTHHPTLGVVGEDVVNTVELNVALATR